MGKDKRAGIEAAKRRASVEATFRIGVLGAVGFSVVAYILVYFLGLRGQVITLHPDTQGLEPLKNALSDGSPLLLQCVSDEVPTHPASIAAARSLYSSGVQVATLRCLDTLPSGKNFFQRFGFYDDALPDKDHPLFFLFANLDPPKRPKGGDLKNTTSIVNFAARESTPKVAKIASEKDFGYHCLRRNACLLLAAAGNIDTSQFEWVAQRHRNVRIATVNTDNVALSFFEQLGITAPRGISPKDPAVFVIRSTMSEEETKARRDAINSNRRKNNKDKKPAAKIPVPAAKFGVHYIAPGAGSDAKTVNSLVSSHILEGNGSGEGWHAVTDVKAKLTRTPESAEEKARRARREEIRRQHRAKRDGKTVDEEVTTTIVDDDASSSSESSNNNNGGENNENEEFGDDDIIVTEDDE